MPKLEAIKRPVAVEMERYEDYIHETLRSDNNMARAMLEYIFSNRGKAIRPLLVFLSAGLCKGESDFPEDSYLAAMLVEMMHTASLVHDDVIDEANFRRGKPSAKALWHSHRAVLIGDYILAKSFSVGMNSTRYDIVGYISNTMSDLIEGELTQSEQSDTLEMTREIYYSIIYKKTASLLGASCGVGFMSMNRSAEEVKAIREFGDNLGMAFQIKDDILDYSSVDQTGKPSCGDLKERKITLPLLTVLETSSDSRRSEIIGLLSEVQKKPGNIEQLRKIINDRGGMEMADNVMREFIDKAKNALTKYPESPYQTSLAELCDYIASRSK